MLLLKAESGSCATGFITSDGLLITNAHVIASLCPRRDCSSLKLFKAPTIDSPPSISVEAPAIEIKSVYNALDTAVLKVSPPPAGGLKPAANSETGDFVFALGFPSCGKLEMTAGKVTARDGIRLFTSTRGSHGSSGSPVITADSQVIGVVNQAANVVDGMVAFFTGSGFDNKAVPIEALHRVLNLDALAAWDESAEMLFEWQQAESERPVSPGRLRFDLDFMAAVKGLSHDALAAGVAAEDALPLFFLDGELGLLFELRPPAAPAARRELAEKLYTSYVLEVRGLRDSQFREIDTAGFFRKLAGSGRSEDHVAELQRIVTSFAGRGYPGFYLHTAGAFAAPALLALLLLVLWSFSLGFTFATARGSLIYRFFVTLLVAILLWPISFIVYLVRRRSSKAR